MTRTRPATRRRSPKGSGEQLRSEIITAVKDLIVETDDVDAVTIRAVAQRVGVTAPSIYLHFADRDALLDAVVSDVFADLDARILAVASGPGSPLQRLFEAGVEYVRFALEHREHYRVAVMEPCIVPPDVDKVIQQGALAHIAALVQECIAAQIFPPGDALPVALELWTSAHGVASLLIAKPYIPWGDAEAHARRALTAAGLGQALGGLFGDDPDFSSTVSWITRRRRR